MIIKQKICDNGKEASEFISECYKQWSDKSLRNEVKKVKGKIFVKVFIEEE